MTWIEACHDRSLQNLPYKVELNRQGKIILSPTRYKHGFYQGEIAHYLRTLLPKGRVAVECAIDTPEGTFVADVAWATMERFRINEERFSCSIAPEICVEIWSMSNTPEELELKRQLYFQQGALEFWYCDQTGAMTFFNQAGIPGKSDMCPAFPSQIES